MTRSTVSPPPSEWSPHQAIWTAWPADGSLWEDHLAFAQAEVAAMVRALAAPGPDGRSGDHVKVLVTGAQAHKTAADALGDCADIIDGAYGDIWLRDTGPIFLDGDHAATFLFNGWGGKYQLEHDDTVAAQVVAASGTQATTHDFVLEGGAVDGDGGGTFLTTRECLLNPNRNAGWTSEEIVDAVLAKALGARKVIWIDRGLMNDHTDGHVDNIARFVAPGVVMCQSPTGDDDPNADRLEEIFRTLAAARDADGTPLKVLRIPSPGLIRDEAGEIVPASHMNFLVGNAAVVLPIYGASDAPCVAETIAVLQSVYPNRRIVPLSSRYILTGGGSFHCITQQQPA